MKRMDFNSGWTYKHLEDEGEGKAIRISHDAMLFEKRSEKSAGGGNVSWFEGRDYIYIKSFYVPAEYEQKHVIFEFEGVYHNAEVLINGKKAAYRPYGYTNLYVDADSYLEYGKENQIQVRAYNSDQPNSLKE